MSDLLLEIKRIHQLMGINHLINEQKVVKKLLLNEDTGYSEIMSIYKKLFTEGIQQLDETEQIYLKNFIDEYNLKFPDGKIDYTGAITPALRESLQKIINEESDDVLTSLFSAAIKKNERPGLVKNAIEKINADEIIKKELMSRSIDPETLVTNNGSPINVLDIVISINNKGGNISDSDISEYFYRGLKDEFERVVDELANPENPVSKMMSDLMDQIDEIDTGTAKVIDDPNIKSGIDDIKKALEPDKSDLNTMVKLDQEIRTGENIDLSVDLKNQEQLKQMLGDDPQKFILDLENFEDIRSVWLIIQHADNDIELQKKIFSLFDTNKQNLITKFPSNEAEIKQGLAMLDDRIQVNQTTTSSSYLDGENLDFLDISNGSQTYGTQGGEFNGNWVPRSIELDGKKYFFETPEDLVSNKEFLDKLNTKRSSMGLEPMEKYLEKMNGRKITIDPKTKNNPIDLKLQDKEVRKKIENAIRDVLYSDINKVKTSDISETFDGNPLIFDPSKAGQSGYDENGLELNFKNFILKEKPNFFKDLEKGKYKNLLGENNNWDPLNKLDTNTKDRKVLLEDWALYNGIDPKLMSDEQVKKLFDDFIYECKNNPTKMKDFIQKSKAKYTVNIINNTKIGNEIEKNFLDKFQKGRELEKFEVVWKPQSEGNALDKTGVDMIIKDDKGNFHFVQIKKSTNNLTIEKSSITGEPVIKGFTWTGIKLNNGFVGLQDAKGNWILYPPQDIYRKNEFSISGYVPALDKEGKQIKGFLKGPKSTHFIDITNKEGDEFFTNLDISNVIPKLK